VGELVEEIDLPTFKGRKIMICPRCKSNSYTNLYKEEIKCLSCGHTDYKIPSEILKEVQEQQGKVGKATNYIRKNAKKYYN
jgi:Zn ribbon nucleic-acid-binding protein